MKKICVKYDENGKICDFSNDSLCFEQENKSVHICALISAEKSVRAYVSSANGNSMVTGEIDPDENGEYLLVIEESYMSKGTLYVAFEEYDAEGYSKRYEPLKIYIDAFVELDEGNSNNVYVVTVNVGQVETLPEGENAYVTNSGSSKDMVLDFGIPAGKSGATPVRGVDYWTEEDKAEIENNVKESLVVDDALSSESENPVQNKVVAEEFGKVRGEMPVVTNDKGYLYVGGEPNIVANVNAVGDFVKEYVEEVRSEIPKVQDDWTALNQEGYVPESKAIMTYLENVVINPSITWHTQFSNKLNELGEQIPEVTTDPANVWGDDKVPTCGSVTRFVYEQNGYQDNRIVALEEGAINLNNPSFITENEETGNNELHWFENHANHSGTTYFADDYAREKLSNIDISSYLKKDYHTIQEIETITITEEVSKIVYEANKNYIPWKLFNLDEIYIRIELSENLSAVPQHAWSCYMNGGTTAKEVAYYITPNTTGNKFTFHSKRMKNGLWFSQSNNTLVAKDYNQAWYGTYTMPGINYINKLSFNVYDIPVGSTITICGREASK